MKEAVLGVLVLGLVAGGVYLARDRHPVPPGGESPTASKDEVDKAIPDVTLADGAVDLNDVRVILSVAPRPPVALSTTRFRVRVESADAPLLLEAGRISFEMTMPMGEHRYVLGPVGGGWNEAEVVLPFCKSGNPRWYAIVEGTAGGRPLAARFRLDLVKPTTGSE